MTKVDSRTYPIMQMTRAQYDGIPCAENMPIDFLETCAIGTKFRCRGSSEIIGQVVKGDDAFCSQYGAGLSVPARFVNRHRARVIPSDSLDSAML